MTNGGSDDVVGNTTSAGARSWKVGNLICWYVNINKRHIQFRLTSISCLREGMYAKELRRTELKVTPNCRKRDTAVGKRSPEIRPR